MSRLPVSSAEVSAFPTTASAGAASSAPFNPPIRRLTVRGEGEIHVVRVEQISWFAAAGNYAVVHTAKRSHILRESMNSLESRLDRNRFLRVSRAALVNLDAVVSIVSSESGSPSLRLEDGTLVPTSMGIRELQRRLESP